MIPTQLGVAHRPAEVSTNGEEKTVVVEIVDTKKLENDMLFDIV